MKIPKYLDIDMADGEFCTSNRDELLALNRDAYVTEVHCIISPSVFSLPVGKYKTNYKEAIIDIEVVQVNSFNEDPIFRALNGLRFGTLNLPFKAFTDNRGKYPTQAVTCIFPYKLYEPETVNYEELAIVGASPVKEKIQLILALRKLASEHGTTTALAYDDITAHLEFYYVKPDLNFIVKRIRFVTSRTAYRDAVADALGISPAAIERAAVVLLHKWTGTPIDDEQTLKMVVQSAIDEVLAHHIENRHWIEPFWDGRRTLKHKKGDITIPRKPKGERDIQPTLHVILELALMKLGIHVVRESDEGVGTLDFRCLYTTASGRAISIGIEFKLAHHKQLKKGIARQLPAYLRAIGSKHGIFAVMWFKSGPSIFDEPAEHTKDEMKTWLEDQAIAASAIEGLQMTSSLIDASFRPSASKTS